MCVVAVQAWVAVSGAGSAPTTRRDTRAALGPGPVTVRLVVRDSHFTPSRIRVVPHTEVRFEVVNRDFIGHEFIIGDDEVHARHETGHEASHPTIPGEVSVPAHSTGVTAYAFHTPGPVVFACHLPGHLAYGMRGDVNVVPVPPA